MLIIQRVSSSFAVSNSKVAPINMDIYGSLKHLIFWRAIKPFPKIRCPPQMSKAGSFDLLPGYLSFGEPRNLVSYVVIQVLWFSFTKFNSSGRFFILLKTSSFVTFLVHQIFNVHFKRSMTNIHYRRKKWKRHL